MFNNMENYCYEFRWFCLELTVGHLPMRTLSTNYCLFVLFRSKFIIGLLLHKLANRRCLPLTRGALGKFTTAEFLDDLIQVLLCLCT